MFIIFRVQLFVFMLFSTGLSSQTCLDGTDAEIRLMLTIEATNTKGVSLKDAYKYVAQLDFKVDTIESIGFQGYSFLKISIVNKSKKLL